MVFQIIVYLCLSLSAVAFGKDLRIVGGEPSNIKNFPFMASLRIVGQNKHICAGTIISDKHILSVAHCIYRMEHYCPLIRVHVGVSNILDTSGSVYFVESVHVHPGFTGEKTGQNGFHNDIAIYTIRGNIEFDQYQKKIDLPTEDITSNKKVLLSGWGLTTYPSDNPPNVIHKATVTILNRSECQDKFNFPVLDDELCTLKEGVGICIGDSGGPVTRNGKIVGIVSFAKPCAKGIPDMHTNVYKHLSFIRSIIGH